MSIKAFVDGLQVGPAWSHLNLTAHPLISATSCHPNYVMLDEALATGRFRVSEVSASGTVPELKVSNGLPQPVLMLDGEELVGAKQNRVLNLTVMVPAETEMTIPVSCVEAGRWRHTSGSFDSSNSTQFARGRARKLAQVSRSMRASESRRSDQSDVWEEISAKSVRMSARSPTAAMAAIYDRHEAPLDGFVRAMPLRELQVGAVFSIGGRIAGVDAFDCDETFRKAAPKLLRSYAIDALESAPATSPSGSDGHAVSPFLESIAKASVTRFKALGLGDDLRVDGLGVAGAALQVGQPFIHLVAFPGGILNEDDDVLPGRTRMARMRRCFH